MARKKKDPIPAGMGWQPGGLSMAQLLERDKYHVAALTDSDIINAHARFMFADEVVRYQDWAKTNPAADVRMYGPLINYVSPFSKDGMAITLADVEAQAGANTLGAGAGLVPNNVFPGNGATDPNVVPQPSGQGAPVTPAVTKPDEQNWLQTAAENTVNALGTAGGWVKDVVEGASRTAVVGLSTPYDTVQGMLRVGAAQDEKKNALQQQYGLTDDEAKQVFKVADDVPEVGVYTYVPGAKEEPTYDEWFNSLPEDRKTQVRLAKDDWLRQGDTINSEAGGMSAVGDSTLLGQAVDDPSLVWGGGEEAKGFLPSPILNERADANSARVYNIMTPEERTRIAEQIRKEVYASEGFMPSLDQAMAAVRPVAWTPGRAIAHEYWDVDTTAFNTMSGVVDFTANLVGDPINLIPGAKGATLATKVAEKIPGTTARALTLGEKVVVESRVGQAFAKGGVAGTRVAMDGVPDALRGRAAVTAAEQANGGNLGRIIDPDSMHLVDPNTGLVKGPKAQTVVSERAWTWLNGGKGQRAVSELTRITSPAEIMLRSNRKMDSALAIDLANSTSEAQTRAILASRMGIDITKPSEFGTIGRRARPALFDAGPMKDGWLRQYFRVAPRSNAHIDLDRTDDAVWQMEAWARGIGMKVDAVIPHLDNFMMAGDDEVAKYTALYGRSGDPAHGIAPVEGLMGAAANHLIGDTSGLTQAQVATRAAVARRLTTAFEGGLNPQHRQWANSNLGSNAFGTVGADGDLGRVLLEHENLSRTAILPDYRTIQRYQGLLGKMFSLMDSAPDAEKAAILNMTFDGLQGITSAWRNVTLVRPAYTLREMIDLSVSTALAGYGSPLTHPAVFLSHALSAAVSRDSASLGGKAANLIARGIDTGTGTKAVREYLQHHEGVATLAPHFLSEQARVNGEGMWDAWNRFIASGETDFTHWDEMFDGLNAYHGNFNIDQGKARIAQRYLDPIHKGEASSRRLYAEALVQRLAHVARDRDMRALADPNITFQDALDAFRDGTRQRKMSQRPDLLNNGDPNLDVAYLQGYRDILARLTNDHPELLDAIASGTFAGEPLLKTKKVTSWRRGNEALVDRMVELLDDDAFRAQMPDQMYVPKDHSKARNAIEMWDNFAEEFFASTGDITDLLVRAPVMRQAYTKRVLEIGKWMTPAAKQQIVANLRAAGDHALARKVLGVEARGHLGVDDVDQIAGAFARKETQRIFYDATKRQNYAFAGRVIMPFLQATTNTFRRWGQMSLENPQMMYRAIKPIYYLQQPGSAVIYDLIAKATGNDAVGAFYTPGRPDQSVNGFFYEDDYGDRRFAYPMLSPIAAALGMGIPGAGDALSGKIAMTGTLGGLNVAGQTINPGMGPIVTLPSAFLLDDLVTATGTKGGVARAIFPYGLPQGTAAEKVWGSILPTMYQRLNTASGDEEMLANMAMKIAPSLMDTGRYDLSTEAGKRSMMYDAQALASRLYLITAIGGAVAPTQMTPQALAEVGPENARHLMLVSEISKEFRRYQENSPDYFAAVDAFVNDFGETALFAVMPRSSSDAPQATNDVWLFREQEPEAYRNYGTVLGYFFAGGDGSFDDPTNPRAYSSELAKIQRQEGDRNYKDPNQFVDDVQNSLGWMLFNQKAREIAKSGASKDQQTELRRQVRAEITAKYPQWTGMAADPTEFTRKIKTMREALTDPAISSLSSAKYIAAYLNARDYTLSQIEKRGIRSLDAKGASDARESLIALSYEMIAMDGTGAFARAYNTLFSRELEVD